MTITLNGTTGITTDGGYTGDGISFADGTPSNTLVTTTGGNVGIGTTAGTTTVSSGLAINNATAGNYPGLEIQTAGVTRMYFNANNAVSYISSVGTNPLVTYTNGAERMRIDSSGRVTMPYQPAFHAKRNAAFNSGSGVIVFEDVTVNISSSYNSSNGKFTAPVAGTYIFLVSFFTNIANAPIDFRILKNGSDIGGNATTGTTTVARDCHAYAITTLAASDYIEVIAAGYGTNIPSGLGIFQTFSGHLIG